MTSLAVLASSTPMRQIPEGAWHSWYSLLIMGATLAYGSFLLVRALVRYRRARRERSAKKDSR